MLVKSFLVVFLIIYMSVPAQASPLPPGPECLAKVEALGRVKAIYDSPMLLSAFEVEHCRVRILEEIKQLKTGYEGQGCWWKQGDIIDNVLITGGFNPQPLCEEGEVIEGVLQSAGDEGGHWVTLSPDFGEK